MSDFCNTYPFICVIIRKKAGGYYMNTLEKARHFI